MQNCQLLLPLLLLLSGVCIEALGETETGATAVTFAAPAKQINSTRRVKRRRPKVGTPNVTASESSSQDNSYADEYSYGDYTYEYSYDTPGSPPLAPDAPAPPIPPYPPFGNVDRGGFVCVSTDDADDVNHCQGTECGLLYPNILSNGWASSRIKNNNFLAIGVSKQLVTETGPVANSTTNAYSSLVTWLTAAELPDVNLTIVTDLDEIATVDFKKYRMIYVPSSIYATQGGINPDQAEVLGDRRPDLIKYVNDEQGSLLTLTQQGQPNPYSFFPFTLDYVPDAFSDVSILPSLADISPNSTSYNLDHDFYHGYITGPKSIPLRPVVYRALKPNGGGDGCPVPTGKDMDCLAVIMCGNQTILTDLDCNKPQNWNKPDCWICGNGRVDPGEECDDGNVVNGDGCSSTCQVQRESPSPPPPSPAPPPDMAPNPPATPGEVIWPPPSPHSPSPAPPVPEPDSPTVPDAPAFLPFAPATPLSSPPPSPPPSPDAPPPPKASPSPAPGPSPATSPATGPSPSPGPEESSQENSGEQSSGGEESSATEGSRAEESSASSESSFTVPFAPATPALPSPPGTPPTLPTPPPPPSPSVPDAPSPPLAPGEQAPPSPPPSPPPQPDSPDLPPLPPSPLFDPPAAPPSIPQRPPVPMYPDFPPYPSPEESSIEESSMEESCMEESSSVIEPSGEESSSTIEPSKEESSREEISSGGGTPADVSPTMISPMVSPGMSPEVSPEESIDREESPVASPPYPDQNTWPSPAPPRYPSPRPSPKLSPCPSPPVIPSPHPSSPRFSPDMSPSPVMKSPVMPSPSPSPSPRRSPPFMHNDFPYCSCTRRAIGTPYTLVPVSHKVVGSVGDMRYCFRVNVTKPEFTSANRKCWNMGLSKVEFDMEPSCWGAAYDVTWKGDSKGATYSKHLEVGAATFKVTSLKTKGKPAMYFQDAEVCFSLEKRCARLEQFCAGGETGQCRVSIFGDTANCCPVKMMDVK